MVEQVITAALTAGVTGVVTSYTTVIALKTDMVWIKKITEQFDERLRDIENRLTDPQLAPNREQ